MPTAPTITVTDNEDGTATVTVSGSDVGTTNTAFYAPVNYDPYDGSNWTTADNITGDGDIDVTPTYVRNRGGVYLWRVESSDGTVAHSNIVQNRVSGSSQTTYERILEAVHAQIAGAGLEGILTNEVKLQTVPDKIDRRLILVAPTDPERMLTGGRQRSNARDDTVYPVTVVYADAANRKQTADKRDQWMRWRQDIARLFRSQHLTGVDEVYDCTITYRDSFDASAWFKENLCVGAMVLNFTAREVRTL